MLSTIEQAVERTTSEAGPAKPGLNSTKLPPGQCSGNRGKRSDAQYNYKTKTKNPEVRQENLIPFPLIRAPVNPSKKVETGVIASRKQHEKTEVLSHLQPSVQPARKLRILSAPGQLDISSQYPGEIASSQKSQSMVRKCLI